MQALLADAQQVASDLQGKLDAEIAAAKAAEERERQEALERERATLVAAQPVSNPNSDIPPGTIVVNPGGGSFMCPVFGAAYTDDFGGAPGHGGIDMFVPTGTQAFAVKSGTVRYVPFEGAGGNTAYLDASDGNTYFYAHLSQFVGRGAFGVAGRGHRAHGDDRQRVRAAPPLRDPLGWGQRLEDRSLSDTQIVGLLSRHTSIMTAHHE